MKLIKYTLAAGFLVTAAALAESVSLRWYAYAGPTPESSVIQSVGMNGPSPSKLNEVPEKRASFQGDYNFQQEWGTELKQLYVATVDDTGSVTHRSVQFEIQSTKQGSKPDSLETHFSTEAVEFNEGDTFILIFQTKHGKEMVFARIYLAKTWM